MDQLRAMALFVRCVELGSVSAAARGLGLSQPTISKVVSGLEAHLGGPLLIRSARGLRLTDAGRRYFEECKAVIAAAAAADLAFREQRQGASGWVRIAASPAFARVLLVPRLPEFLALHPKLQVDLRVSDRLVDLVEEEIDVAFRVTLRTGNALVARRIGLATRIAVAAPDYLAIRSEPMTPDGLAGHDCIYFNDVGALRRWRFTRGGHRYEVAISGRFQANSSETVRQGALAGLGIAVLPAWMVGEDLERGRLIRILRDCELRPLPVQAVSSVSSRHSAKVKAVKDFFAATLRDALRGA